MAVSFVTPGAIDLDAALSFGVSAKTSSNPIGYFGTGLKYAIAVLLRQGHSVRLVTDKKDQTFNIQSKTIRGKEFQFVYLDNEKLSFTTDLGKAWQPWMAYHELHSNTIDEDGLTIDYDISRSIDAKEDCEFIMGSEAGYSALIVDGPHIDACYAERDTIFCNSRILSKSDYIEIREGNSNFIYYKGVRVQQLSEPTIFTYNLTAGASLTEDRTLANSLNLHRELPQMLAFAKDKEALKAVVTAKDEFFEYQFDFDHSHYGTQELFDAIIECKDVMSLNESARRFAQRKSKMSEEPFELDKIQEKQLRAAVRFLDKLGFPIKQYKILPRKLSAMVVGEARNGNILISPKAFEKGTKYLAETLFEEMVHLKDGVYDETRAMQDVLIRYVMTLGEKLNGKPL